MAVEIDVKKLTDGFGALTKAIETLDKRLEGLPKASTSALDLALGTPKSLDSYIASIGRLDKAVGKSFSSIVRELRLFTIASQKATTSGFSALTGALQSIIKIADSLSFGATGAINTEVVLQKLMKLREVGDIIADFGANVRIEKTTAVETSKEIRDAFRGLMESFDSMYNIYQKGNKKFYIDERVVIDQMQSIYSIGEIISSKGNINTKNISGFSKNAKSLKEGLVTLGETFFMIEDFGRYLKSPSGGVEWGKKEFDVAKENLNYYTKMMGFMTKALSTKALAKYANVFDRINDVPIDYDAVAKHLRGFARGVKDIQQVLHVAMAFTAKKTQEDATGTNALDEIDMFGKFVKRFVGNLTRISKNTDVKSLRLLELTMRGITSAIIDTFDFFDNNFDKLMGGKFKLKGVFAKGDLFQYFDLIAKVVAKFNKSLPRDISADRMKAVSISIKSVANDFPKLLNATSKIYSNLSLLQPLAKPNQLLKRLRFVSTLTAYLRDFSRLSSRLPNKDSMKIVANALGGFANSFSVMQDSFKGFDTLNIKSLLTNMLQIQAMSSQLKQLFNSVRRWNIRANDADKMLTVSNAIKKLADGMKILIPTFAEMIPFFGVVEKLSAYNKRVRFLRIIRVLIKDTLKIINDIAGDLKVNPDQLVARLQGFSLALKNLGNAIRAIILSQQELQGIFQEAVGGNGVIGLFRKGIVTFGSLMTGAISDTVSALTNKRIKLPRIGNFGWTRFFKEFEPLLRVVELFAVRLSRITSKISDIEKITQLTRAFASIKRFVEFVSKADFGRDRKSVKAVRNQVNAILDFINPFIKAIRQLKGVNTGVISEFAKFISSLQRMIGKGVFNIDFSQAKMSGFKNWANDFAKEMEGGVRALAKVNVNAKQIEKAKNLLATSVGGASTNGQRGRVPTLMPEADNDPLTENDLIRRGFAQRSGELRRDFLQRIINDVTGPLIRTVAFANPFSVVKNLQTQIMTVFRDSGKIIGEYANQVAMGAQNMMRMFNPTNLLRSQGFNLAVDYDALSSQLKVFGDLNAEQLALAQEMANEVGVKYPLSANEALAATLDLLKAGQDLSKVQFILPASADLAALSESGDLQNVTKFLIGATNGYRKFSNEVASGFDNINMATDVVFRAANDSTAAVDSLMEGLLRAAPSASAFGLSLEETAALLTVFEDAGIRGQEAGTQLRAVLDELQMAGYTGRDSLERALSGQSLGSNLFQERFERQGLRILQSATAQGNSIDALIERYHEMGTASDASGKLMDNLKGDIEQLRGSFETALTVAFVPTLERFFRPIVKALRMVVDGFAEMNPVLRDTIVNGALITVMGLSLGATLTFVTAKVVALSGWFMHLVGGMGLAIMKAPMLITSLGGIVASFSVLASGIGILATGFFFLSDAVTQTFNAVEKNIGGAGDAFRNFASQTKVAFNEVGKLFGRVRVAYKTVFEKDDAKALQERGEVVTDFFSKMSMRASNFIKSIRGITTSDILVFLENTKSRFGVIRGILQDLRIGWMGVITGQESYVKRLNVGFAKILYSATDFVRKMTKISPEKALEMIQSGDTDALIRNARFQQRLMESMTLFRQGDVIRGVKRLFDAFAVSIRGVFERNSDKLAEVGVLIFNSLNPFKRLETALRLFGQKDLANELKAINDQFAQGFRGIILTITNIMAGKGLLEAVRAGFGIQGAEFVRQTVSAFQQIANGIGEVFRSIGVTLSFNPLRGLFDTIKTIPFNAIQSLIDSFKALGKVTLSALGGDMGAIAKVSALSAAVVTLVGPKVLGKFGGVFNTLKKFGKFLLVFEVIEAVTKNLDTLLNKNFFEGLTSVIADLSIGLLELLGLDEASLNRVRGIFDEIGVIVQRTVDQIDRAITSLIINLEDSFPAVFGQSEKTKRVRQARELVEQTRPFLEAPVGQQAVDFGFSDMLRRTGLEEKYIEPINDLFKGAVVKAVTEDSVAPLSEFFYRTANELRAAGISEENIKPFLDLVNTFSTRKTGGEFGAGFMELMSGGDLFSILRREESPGGQFSRDAGIQNALFSYGRQLVGEQNAISPEQALSNLGQVARLDKAQISSNLDIAQMALDNALELGIKNLTSQQIQDVVDIAKAMGDTTSKEVIQNLIDANLGEVVIKSFDQKLYSDLFTDVFSQSVELISYEDNPFMFAEGALLENLSRIAKAEAELNVTVPEELIREQIFNGLKAGGEDFTNTTLEIADMVRAVDTGASTYSAVEAVNLLDSLAKATTESERAKLLAGRTVEQVVAEALAGVETSPELKKRTGEIATNLAKVIAPTTPKDRQKQAAAQAILLAGSSRFTGDTATDKPQEMFTPMELTTQSRKGIIDLLSTIRKMSGTQIAGNFQAIAKNLQDMGIFASENSDILGLFLGQLNDIYETNPELGDMAEAFSLLQTNTEIANKTLEQMGITVDSPTYQEELTKLLQQLGSLDAMGNIVIPITVTADAENLVGGLTPEEIQRMADLGNLIDDYTQILAGTSTGVVEASKTVDELIQEYSTAAKELESKALETEKEIASMRVEFMESEAEAQFNYDRDRKRALQDHLREMKRIGDTDFKDAVANRNAASALEALNRQKDAKEQFDESEKRTQEDFELERQKALSEYQLRQQSAQNELLLERQKLEALRVQRDNAVRLQLAQYQQEYNALMAKVNANASANNSIVANTQTTMQQVATSIAGKLNEALRVVQSTPIGQAFGNMMTGILNTINAARIHTNIVQQGGFSGNQYNKPELNPNKGVIVIPPSFGGGRADGGKLMANRWYMTGEDGPEPLFMGSKSGYISTMKDVMKYQRPSSSMASGGVNINVDLSNMQISGVQNANDIARQVEERVVKGITQAFKRNM